MGCSSTLCGSVRQTLARSRAPESVSYTHLDIRTKSYGTNNKINMVKATLEGLKQLRSAEEVAKLRGKTVEEILG